MPEWLNEHFYFADENVFILEECFHTLSFGKVGILKRANLSAADIAQLADAVEPIAFADGEEQYEQLTPNESPCHRIGPIVLAPFRKATPRRTRTPPTYAFSIGGILSLHILRANAGEFSLRSATKDREQP